MNEIEICGSENPWTKGGLLYGVPSMIESDFDRNRQHWTGWFLSTNWNPMDWQNGYVYWLANLYWILDFWHFSTFYAGRPRDPCDGYGKDTNVVGIEDTPTSFKIVVIRSALHEALIPSSHNTLDCQSESPTFGEKKNSHDAFFSYRLFELLRLSLCSGLQQAEQREDEGYTRDVGNRGRNKAK